MTEPLQLQTLVQPAITIAAAALALWRPWTAVMAYLFAYSLPYIVTGGSAPLMYPEWSLGVPLAAHATRTLIRGAPGGAAFARFERMVMLLALLLAASVLAGSGPAPAELFLGTLFLINARQLVGDSAAGLPRATGGVLAWSLLLAMHYLRVGGAASAGVAFDEAAYAVTGDRNFRGFFLGCGAIVAWVYGFNGVPWLVARAAAWRWIGRGAALGCAIFVTYVMVLFQTRGMIVSLAAGGLAALIHTRPSSSRLLAGVAGGGLVVYAISLSPASATLMGRFRQDDMRTANARTEIASDVLTAYAKLSPVRQVFGMGSNWIYETFQVSPHNSFVRFLAEQGIVGAGVFAAIVLACARRAWRQPCSDGAAGFPLLVFMTAAALSIEPHIHAIFWIGLCICARPPAPDGGDTREHDPAWAARHA